MQQDQATVTTTSRLVLQQIEAMMSGNPPACSSDAHINALLAEMRSVSRDRRALESLGRHTLALVSGHIKAGLHAERALMVARDDSNG